MSLEDSMKALAESNLKLAAAQEHYAGVIEKFGSLVVATNGEAATVAAPAKEPAAAKGGKGAKGGKAAAKTEPAADAAAASDGFGGDDDGFGGGGEASGDEPEVPEKLTGDQVKAKLLEVRDAYGDKAPALKIINDLGYAAIPDVKPADYKKVWIAAEKAIAAAP